VVSRPDNISCQDRRPGGDIPLRRRRRPTGRFRCSTTERNGLAEQSGIFSAGRDMHAQELQATSHCGSGDECHQTSAT